MPQELEFIESESGEWFYAIEQRSAPKDAWDWTDYADVFGPFPTLLAAQEHEYASDSDTSGAEIVEFGRGQMKAGINRLIARAMPPLSHRSSAR